MDHRKPFAGLHRRPQLYGLDGSYHDYCVFLLGADAGNDGDLRRVPGLAPSPALVPRLRRRYGDAMACRISEIVIDARDPERLAKFWADVLGYVEIGREPDGIEIGPPGTGFGGPQPTLVFDISDRAEPATRVKLPLHLDVSATDRDQEAELRRLLELGARHADIGQTGEESWYVLQDPEGNEFCLLRTRIDPVP